MAQFISDLEAMHQALSLARQGVGFVEPNPPVGCVIRNESGSIVGAGYHQQFGGPHAEVHALAHAGEQARGATMFVTLEPCCHFGKTPPCTRAVIQAGIRRVVIAMRDPASHVAGKGVAELTAAGISVEVGLCEQDARRLTAPFVTLQLEKRPWVHAKWAMTLDGKIAAHTGHSQWITGDASRAYVHALRGRMDAIVVGRGTALADDPRLTARPAGPRVATRIVLDRTLSLPLKLELFQTARDIPTIVATLAAAPEDRRHRLEQAGVEILSLPADDAGNVSVRALLNELGLRNMSNILVEGGARLLGSVHDACLIDEVHAFIAPKIVGGAAAPSPMGGQGLDRIPAIASLQHIQTEQSGSDVLIHGITHLPGIPGTVTTV